jgi:alpha-L-arabinofuranosidase
MVTVNMINRDKDRVAPVTLGVGPGSFAGTATLHEVTGDGPKAANSFEEPANVATGMREIEVKGADAELELAPSSVTVLKARLGS